MKSNVYFNNDGNRIEFNGALAREDLAKLAFTEYEQTLLAQPADTAVRLFQVLETFWRAHERTLGADPARASEAPCICSCCVCKYQHKPDRPLRHARPDICHY